MIRCRILKLAALTLASGGVMLQLAGCATSILDTLVQNVIGLAVGAVLTAIVRGVQDSMAMM